MPRLLSLALALLSPGLAAAAPPAVSAAAYHPRAKTVAFGTHGEVRFFDPSNGASAGTLAVPAGRVTALAYSPTGSWLAVASGEPGQSGAVSLVPLDANGKPSGSPKPAATQPDVLYGVTFSSDGTRLATAGYDRVIRVYEVAPDGAVKLVHALRDHSDTIYALAFQPNGLLLASAAGDRALKVWDAVTGTRLYTLGESTDWLYALAWSPDGRFLGAAGVDRSVRVWAADRTGGRLVHSVFAHQRPVSHLAFSGDGATLFSVGQDGVVKAWDAAKMTEGRVFPAQQDVVLGFGVRGDGRQLALGLFNGSALLVDATSGKTSAQALPAKPVPPKGERTTPTGVPRGRTTRVVVAGQHLDQMTAVSANVAGVQAKLLPTGRSATGAEVELTVAPSAPVGALQLTLQGPGGKSAPLTVALDRYPAVAEAGATDSARQSMSVTLPATVAGAVDRAGDVDFFRFEAKAGDAVGAQVVAGPLGSKLDPVLVLTDVDGRVLAEGGGVLGFRVAAAGRYAVGVRDREYRGGPDFTYRLHVGDVPVVTGVFPLGVQRGKTATVHVSGVNLGSPTGLTASVTIPADAAPGSRVPVPLPPTGEAPLGAPGVTVDEFPGVVIDPAAGAEVRVPGSADGILAKPGDAQTVRFAAKKGQRLIVEVTAARAGSPVDSVAEVLDVSGKPVPRAVLRATARTFVAFRDHDSVAPGIRLTTWPDLAVDDYLYIDGEVMKILALPRNPDDDCQFYQVAGRRSGFLDTTPCHHSMDSPMYRVEVHPPGRTFPPNGQPVFALNYRNDDGGAGYGTDSRVFFDPPADGVYQVRVSDTRGAGGPTHAFRVTVRPPRPDFRLAFSPAAPAVWRGGAVPVGVTATRLDGFEGEIRLKLDGLPTGFHAPETTIEPGQINTSFALFAPADATVPPNTKLRLVGTATVGGQDVTRTADGGALTAIDTADIRTTVRQDTLVIRPGHETKFVVDIERRNGFGGRVPLEVRGLPHGVRVLNVGLNGILVTERDTSREVTLYCEPWVRPTDHPIVVLARHEQKGADHAARSVLLRVVP
jgi:WD40 repeat protein